MHSSRPWCLIKHKDAFLRLASVIKTYRQRPSSHAWMAAFMSAPTIVVSVQQPAHYRAPPTPPPSL
jgi:hypothetical protein